jgi:hypothetical protein
MLATPEVPALMSMFFMAGLSLQTEAGITLGLEVPWQYLLLEQDLSPSQWQSVEHLFLVLLSSYLKSTCLQLTEDSTRNVNLLVFVRLPYF